MSLISLKNFISPLTNIVNLATIIVIGLVFFIYRYSGGGVALVRKNQPAATFNREVNAPKAALIEKKVVPSVAPAARPIESNDQSLDELLEKPKPDAANLRNEKSGAGNGSSLDDIAKQLGVE